MKIKVWAEVQPGNGEIEIPDEDLLDMPESHRERVIYDYVDSWVNGRISSGYAVLVPVVEKPKRKKKL